ncbi:MAG: hypothetical protein SGJ04_03280 [Bacteroidota bacterium]|nr:hypothetical protein [Bacteroidota bacterium]
MSTYIDTLTLAKAEEIRTQRSTERKALLVTVGIYVLLGIITFFLSFGVTDPPMAAPSTEGAVGIMLGDPDVGSGGFVDTKAGYQGQGNNTDRPTSQPENTPPSSNSENQAPFATDPNGEAVNVPNDQKKQQTKINTNYDNNNTNNNTTTKRKVNQDLLFNGTDGGNDGANGKNGDATNRGNTDKPGLQGDKNGVPGGGNGLGVDGYTLTGRTAVKNDNCNITAAKKSVLVIKIVVDADGNVVETGNVPAKGSTINDADLIRQVKNCLENNWKFSPSPQGQSRQTGYVKFQFRYD